MRLIVLVPDDEDLLSPESRKYFDNFVWHVRDMVSTKKLHAHVLVAERPMPEPRKPEPRRAAGW